MPLPGSNSLPIDQAVLLVGGRGTRMWPLTADAPKGLLPLAGTPFVGYQLRQLSAAGISSVYLAVGREFLGAWERYAAASPWGLDVRIAVEEEPLDTAGPVRALLDRLGERFLVLNGDVVVQADLAPLLAHPGSAALGLIEVADTSAYGVVVTRADGTVERFIEKPPTPEAPARTINAGVYALTRACLSGYPEGRLSFEHAVFPALAAAGDLSAVQLTGSWLDIGTPALYLAAHGAVYRAAKTPHEAVDAAVSGVQAGAWSWIGPGARVATAAVIEEAVVMAGAEVGEGSVVRNAIIGHHARIGAGATITGAAVIGPGAEVGSGCEADQGIRVAPGATLAPGSVTFRAPK